MRSPERCGECREDAASKSGADAASRPAALPAGKSKALRWIEPRLDPEIAHIPSFFSVPVIAWRAAPQTVLARCREQFSWAHRLAIRSDARAEDGEQTHAGAYKSLLNVEPAHLFAAIDEVGDRLRAPGDAVLIQAMARSIRFTGVAATHRIDDGAPWYCIELNAGGEPCVTAGRANGRLYAFARGTHHSEARSGRVPVEARAALKLLMHVESVVGATPVEIEFAMCGQHGADLHAELLQVRRFPKAEQRWAWRPDVHAPTPLLPALAGLTRPDGHDDVHGSRTLYSLMADWNPAELIGSHPRPLSLSLFECLISDRNWWQAREDLGYRSPPAAGSKLLTVLGGRPFVDVRRSANSLLPAAIDAGTAQRLVDHWLAKLAARPELHDKVEFAVYRTARDFRRETEIHAEYVPILGSGDLVAWEDSLRALTARMMTHDAQIIAPPADAGGGGFAQAMQYASGIARAFAAIARIAFVAGSQLRSAVERGALAPERMQWLVATADAQTADDDSWPAVCEASQQGLRSGMFDIRQERWIPVSRSLAQSMADGGAGAFTLTAHEARDIDALLREAGLPLTAAPWLAFVQRSTSRRERAKRALGYAIDRIFTLMLADARRIGMRAEDLSWLSLSQWLADAAVDEDERTRRRELHVRDAQRAYREQSRIVTSPVLADESDRYWADSLGILPNFVGSEIADAPVHVILDPAPAAREHLRGRIAVIPQADPGYDWLFDCGIAGLVTAWGGANSHMAIRCAETGTTAAIGCGEAAFSRISRAARARIDPQGGSISTP